jgi:predicted NBD/HSP70 family sugar kinase
MELFDTSWPFSGRRRYPGNHQTLAEDNRRLILGLICRRKCLSQKNLAATTKLQASTVSNIVRDLKNAGLVEDGTALKAERAGPKETVLEIVPGYCWSVGISLGQEHRLVLVNAAGHIIDSSAFPPGGTVGGLIEALPARLEEFKQRWQLDGNRFAGIGVSVSGAVEPQSGVVMLSYSLQEEGYPLKAQMEAALQVPVLVDRNVVCGAYAERVAGMAREAESFLNFSITALGEGRRRFGLASVINDRIFRGNNSAAGEVEFLMDRFLSSEAPLHTGSEAADRFYRQCGEGLAAILNLLDIGCLVLACDDREFTDERFGLLQKAMAQRLVSIPRREFTLYQSRLQAHGPVLGAALLMLHRKMEKDLSLSRRDPQTESTLASVSAHS